MCICNLLLFGSWFNYYSVQAPLRTFRRVRHLYNIICIVRKSDCLSIISFESDNIVINLVIRLLSTLLYVWMEYVPHLTVFVYLEGMSLGVFSPLQFGDLFSLGFEGMVHWLIQTEPRAIGGLVVPFWVANTSSAWILSEAIDSRHEVFDMNGSSSTIFVFFLYEPMAKREIGDDIFIL